LIEADIVIVFDSCVPWSDVLFF